MQFNRRQFMASAAVFSALAPGRLRAQPALSLKAAPSMVRLAPEEYPETALWTFNNQSPGAEIRLKQGQSMRRLFENGLAESSSVHWHGIRGPNAMDGVPGVTQDPVLPGQSFLYDFQPPDAGTFWYHSHQNSVEQMARGLYGPLIIEETTPPDVDRDEVIVLDDWRLTQKAEIDPNFANPHDFSHAGRMGNFITANSSYDLKYQVKQNDRLRLRLINAANARIFNLALQGLEGWIVAIDGQPLATPEIAKQMVLAPGQRIDLMVDVTAQPGAQAYLVRVDRDKGFAQTTFEVTGSGAQARRTEAVALPANPVEGPGDLASAQMAPLLMEGGAMGQMQSAKLQGVQTSMGDLAGQGKFWAFNGTVGQTDVPLASLQRGETLRIPMTNQTAFPHAMHLHGHHFREVLADGSFGPLRDTLLVLPNEKREIAFVADNPGDWLFHCHMLAHQAAGMRTWIKVA